MATENTAIVPVIGMGVTRSTGSDRYPYTISRIAPNGRRMWVKADEAKVVSGSELDGSAVYEYTSDEDAPEVEITLRKNGRWERKGASMTWWSGYSIGERSYYRDPHF